MSGRRGCRLARGTHEALPDKRNEGILVYINGEFYRRDEAKISVFDSGFLVGDGVWEGLRLHGGEFAFLGLHLDRLFEGARAIHLDIGMTREEITSALRETVRRNGMEGSSGVHVRLMVTRGDKKTPSQDPRLVVGGPNVVIIAEHKVADPGVRTRGVRLFTSTVRRPPPDTLDQRLNCHSKLHEVVALVQALEAGADEALMLDPTGAVATCNATNFFIVRRGRGLCHGHLRRHNAGRRGGRARDRAGNARRADRPPCGPVRGGHRRGHEGVRCLIASGFRCGRGPATSRRRSCTPFGSGRIPWWWMSPSTATTCTLRTRSIRAPGRSWTRWTTTASGWCARSSSARAGVPSTFSRTWPTISPASTRPFWTTSPTCS